jgi:hypothetical protein
VIRIDHEPGTSPGEYPDPFDEIDRLMEAVDALATQFGVAREAIVGPLIEILNRRSTFERLKTRRDVRPVQADR